MNREQQIETVKRFVSLHRNDDPITWLRGHKFPEIPEHGKLLRIYFCLINGFFGPVVNNNSNFKFEIRAYVSKSGDPIIFEWTDMEQTLY